MLNPIGLSMQEMGRVMASPATMDQGIYLAHDLDSNQYFVLDRLNNSDQQPFEFETFDEAYSFAKIRERTTMEKQQEKKVSPAEIERFATSRKSQQILKDGTKDIDSMEQLVNQVSPVISYGRVNSLLLSQSHGEQDFMTKQAWTRNQGLQDVNFDQLNGVKVFVPNPKQQGQPVTFGVGKMYSVTELAAKYPDKSPQIQAMTAQRNLMKQAPQNERLGAMVGALRELQVPKPAWVWSKNQIHAIQTHMSRHMAFASAGLTDTPFHFNQTERQVMANLKPDELKEMFSKSMGLASKISRMANRQLYQMKNQQRTMSQSVQTKQKER
ncbi:hypothetical protein [Limosilactobacillus mucosae]|uniref:hypothetical protein n=1 Tax=Limosilactobacillus mucosae TaxID=97478 RepID=UPI0022E81199|nr:hypothetical protein [Limosilactobacillus mucosae]